MTAERDEELRVFLSEMRLVKDDFRDRRTAEGRRLDHAGFEDVVKVLDKAEATSERYIEGTFFLRARVEGNDIGYGSICAAPARLHAALGAQRRPGPLRRPAPAGRGRGDAHLLHRRRARTLPVNGTYSEIQKKIYDAVYEAQEAGIAA